MRSPTYLRPSTVQIKAYTGTSAAVSNAFGAYTFAIRITADTDCHYLVGASPTATTSLTRLPANVVEVIAVNPGEKIAAIRVSTSGILNVTEMTS